MIGNLVTCSLMAYKVRMEYRALDFDGDRPAQYKEIRKELVKLYEIEDVSTKRSPGPRPGVKFPYEIELEFIPASWAGPVI